MERQYYHRAHAHGIFAQIHRPIHETVHVRPQSSLPWTGGFGTCHQENFNLHNMISFESAHTQVSGDESDPDGRHNNLAMCTIEGLNLLNVITIDRLVSRLTTRHIPDAEEPEIVPIGSSFEGFRVSGKEVKVHLATGEFTEHATFSSLRDKYESNVPFRSAFRKRHGWEKPGNGLAATLRNKFTEWQREHDSEKFPASRGYLTATLVDCIEHSSPEIDVCGNVIVIPHVGRLFLGEMVISYDSRRLSMLRFEFGSPDGGGGSIGGTDAGGSFIP